MPTSAVGVCYKNFSYLAPSQSVNKPSAKVSKSSGGYLQQCHIWGVKGAFSEGRR